MIKSIISVGRTILILTYMFGGLINLVLAFNPPLQIDVVEYYTPSWKICVIALAVGNHLDCILVFGFIPCIWLLSLTITIVTFMEEISLSNYGLVFGEYQFTNSLFELGPEITTKLPSMVLALWMCLIYPTICMTNYIISDNRKVYYIPSLVEVYKLCQLIAISTILLVAFDVVCEPPATLWGHKLYHYVAFVDPLTPHLTYTPSPDWVYKRGQPLQGLYYNIPLQVLCSFLSYSIAILSCTLDYAHYTRLVPPIIMHIPYIS